jgi:hypothetical protein
MADYANDSEDVALETDIAEPAAAAAPKAIPGLRQLFGSSSGAASWEQVGLRLRELYINNELENARRELAQKRDDLYKGRGHKYLEQMIDTAFKSKFNRDQRKALIPWSKWNHVIGRIVGEKAKVYAVPAKRRVANGDELYQKFLKRVRMDACMKELDRKLVLHEDVWVQYRVRNTPRGREPVLDVISPAKFWAITHPNDPTMLIGIILDQRPGGILTDMTRAAFRVWTDAETFLLDGAGRVMEHTVEVWPLGRMPGVLATTVPPSTKGEILACEPLHDGVAAHEVVWFLNLTVLKESKSKNNQKYASGDVDEAVFNQDADTDTDVVLPEGVQVQAIESGMDLKQFTETSTQVLDDAAANHGIPPSVTHQRDATSGAEVYLRRIPLGELRLERIEVMRVVERDLVEIQAGINGLPNAGGGYELGEYAFDPEGFTIDFGEIRQPLTPQEQDSVFEKRRQLGLTDTIEETMARNPDLETPEAAEAELELHNERETKRVRDPEGDDGAQRLDLDGARGPNARAERRPRPERSETGHRRMRRPRGVPPAEWRFVLWMTRYIGAGGNGTMRDYIAEACA